MSERLLSFLSPGLILFLSRKAMESSPSGTGHVLKRFKVEGPQTRSKGSLRIVLKVSEFDPRDCWQHETGAVVDDDVKVSLVTCDPSGIFYRTIEKQFRETSSRKILKIEV